MASRPIARAKSRIWRGLTTASGSPAPLSAAATAISKPPVASSTTRAGAACSQTRDQPLQAGAITGDGKGLTRRQQMDIKPVFGDIDADEHRYHDRVLIHDPSL